jgi:hypothetical protein
MKQMTVFVRRLMLALAAAATPLLLAAPAHAAGNEPAAGAPLGDVMLATFGAGVLTVAMLAMGSAHRSGRITFLDRAAAWSERQWGMPGWSALPGAISLVALLVALIGMYWDISLHIDDGRDPGPLANPAHYLILIGLFGVLVAGFVSIVLPRERPGSSAVRITRSWYAPLGGVLLFSCASFSLLGFPLDDAWHRLFGQDVTLWGPTHLMLFGGAAMTLIGRSVLLVEGGRAARKESSAGGRREETPLFLRFQRASLAGSFLIGLSTFQGEFDFGVPQFPLLFQPVLIALAAAVALVAARIWAGKGGALIAAAMFIAIRGLVTVLVGPVFGETVPHFPLYLAEAALVELAALSGARERPLAFGALSGALIGTVGLAAEWGWSHIWMPLPWPGSLLPYAALVPLVAVAGGVIGGLIGASLASDRVGRPRLATPALASALVAVAAVVGYGLNMGPGPAQSAHVTLTSAGGGPDRTVSARVVLNPRDAGKDAQWLTVTAWQGHGFVVDRLERVGDGTYRTTKPIPVHGSWKTLIRLQSGDSLQALPIYMPRDDAIPAAEVPARTSFTRSFVADRKLLQREAKPAAGWLAVFAYGSVLACALALLGLLAWGLRRLALAGEAGWPRRTRARRARAGQRAAPA